MRKVICKEMVAGGRYDFFWALQKVCLCILESISSWPSLTEGGSKAGGIEKLFSSYIEGASLVGAALRKM